MNRVLVVVLAGIAGSSSSRAQPTPESAGPAVVVTVGEGIVKRPPDRAWVSVATETRAPKPGEAQRADAAKMTEVLAKLHGAGVPENAVQTAAYTVHAEYDYVEGRQELRGYVARNQVEVRVDELPRLGEILDLVVAAGAASVSGVRFDLQQRERAEQEALQQAVAKARARADAAAAAAGLEIERVLKIEERGALEVPPQPVPMLARAEMADVSTPISPGELEVRASVTLTCKLRVPTGR
jgi:uncharacterized protein YggE